MPIIDPYTSNAGNQVYQLEGYKVIINPESSRNKSIDLKISYAIYETDSEGKIKKDSTGRSIYKKDITRHDVIKAVHDATHYYVGEPDPYFAKGRVENYEADTKHYFSRDGDNSRDMLGFGDYLNEADKMENGKFVCAEYAATEHYFLIKHGITDAKFCAGTTAFPETTIFSAFERHAMIYIDDGKQVIETTVPMGTDPVRNVAFGPSINEQMPVATLSSTGQIQYYSLAKDFNAEQISAYKALIQYGKMTDYKVEKSGTLLAHMSGEQEEELKNPKIMPEPKQTPTKEEKVPRAIRLDDHEAIEALQRKLETSGIQTKETSGVRSMNIAANITTDTSRSC